MTGWYRKQREVIINDEARRRIKIEDYGDEICFTFDGFKLETITGDMEADIAKLKSIRDEYIRKCTEH